MGAAKNKQLEDDGLSDFVQQLIDGGHLEDAALGVAKLFVSQGIDALSEKQNYVFQKYIIEAHTTQTCERCGNSIPWVEMYEAIDNGGLCSWCDHMRAKMQKE